MVCWNRSTEYILYLKEKVKKYGIKDFKFNWTLLRYIEEMNFLCLVFVYGVLCMVGMVVYGEETTIYP